MTGSIHRRAPATSHAALALAALCAGCVTVAPEPPVTVVAISTSTQAARPAPLPPPPPPAPPEAAAPVPPPTRPIPVPAVAAPPAFSSERAEHQRALDESRARLRAGRLGQAKERLEAASALAAGLGGRARLRTLELATELHAKEGDREAAEATGLSWLGSCDGSRCRSESLAALRRLVPGPPLRRTLASRLDELAAADRCLASARARPSALPPCLGAAQTAYEQAGDKLQLAEVALARARGVPAADRKAAVAAFTLAAGRCEEERCSGLRRQALDRLRELHAALGDHAAAASAALQENELAIRETLAADPVHVRSKATVRACSAHDAVAGAGACRVLEKKLLGHHSFVDFSTTRARGPLGLQLIQDVAHEYAVLLEPCVSFQAELLSPPQSVTLALRWRVLPSGRVDEVHVAAPEADDGPFATCARAQFAYWRYPRPAAAQQLEQTFTVKASAREP